MLKCDYGCGQEAKYQMSNGKWCCESFYTKCPEIRRKNKQLNKGKKRSNETIKKISISLKGKPKTEEHKEKLRKPKTEEHKEKLRKPSIKKKLAWTNERKLKQKEYMVNFGAKYLNTFITKESITKLSNKIKKSWLNPNSKFNSSIFRNKIKQQCINGHSKLMNSKPRNKEKMKRNIEKTRQRLLNGDALKMIKSIKKISKEEIKLRNLVKELFSDCQFQYPVFNYSLDVALPQYKIAIEYDGYYHFENITSKEEKEYYKIRRNKIENEGWKFLRYTMFDKFPDLEKISSDIKKILENES